VSWPFWAVWPPKQLQRWKLNILAAALIKISPSTFQAVVSINREAVRPQSIRPSHRQG
jgi:hypothetical protein